MPRVQGIYNVTFTLTNTIIHCNQEFWLALLFAASSEKMQPFFLFCTCVFFLCHHVLFSSGIDCFSILLFILHTLGPNAWRQQVFCGVCEKELFWYLVCTDSIGGFDGDLLQSLHCDFYAMGHFLKRQVCYLRHYVMYFLCTACVYSMWLERLLVAY